MRVLDIALKDFSQILRDWKSLLFLVAMPVAFTFFMGFAYAGTVSTQETQLALGWVNGDPDGLLSRELFAQLSGSEALRLEPVAAEQVNDLLRQEEFAGILVVPEQFSLGALEGETPQVTLITDPLTTPGQALNGMVRAALTRVLSAAEISRLSLDAVQSRGVLEEDAAAAVEQQQAFSLAAEKWAAAASQNEWVKVEKVVLQAENLPLGGNPYNQASPGILVQFAIFGLTTSAQILTQERKTRTLQRLMTTAARPWEIVGGHLLAMFSLTFMQTLMLVFFGQLILKVNYLNAPLAALLLALGLALWVASLGLLIGVMAKGEEQVILFSMLAMFLFSALGGAWFPLEGAGRAFASLGRLTPSAWAMEGFQNLLIRGLGLSSALLPAGILLAYALVFFLLAVWRFRAGQET